MKKLSIVGFLLICINLSPQLYSQTIYKNSIDNGGASVSNTNLAVFYTIGEVNVQEVTVDGIRISEGFISANILSDAVYIHDANFEQALIDLGVDSDGSINEQILRSDAFPVTSLFVQSKNIADLTGIEAFINLTSLYCGHNQLTDLDVTQNTALVNLDCEYNNLSVLDVSHNTGLTFLNCSGNGISILDISQNTSLTQLYCHHNSIQSLDVTPHKDLYKLYCYSNELQVLNVLANSELSELMCHNNQLSTLDVTMNTKLTRLECFANQLQVFDVSQNPDLYWIRCGANPLTTLDLSNNVNLTRLECDLTGIKHIDMRNGNNHNVIFFNALNNPKLSCISVDDELADFSGWIVDPGVIFCSDCGYNTKRGSEVVVMLDASPDNKTSATYAEVTSSGQTTLEIQMAVPELPAGYQTGEPSQIFDITTTAVYSGNIEIGIDYGDIVFEDETSLRMLHYEDYQWLDKTTSIDTENDIIYGQVTSLSPFVIVEDALPPVIVDISYPVDPLPLGGLAEVVVTYEDNNLDEALLSWGDGSGQEPGVIAGSSISWSHTYSAPGVYEVFILLTDLTGNMVEESIRYIVIYDPSGGFVTGGGWIYSPEGAYPAEPTLTGKANFGFVSKYKKGTTVPTGNTEFQFTAGDLNFNSDLYEWLVIAGPRAMFKGDGQINGMGTYGFLVSAIDGQIPGGGDLDKFRIKIWVKETEVIVYDNQMDDDEDAAPLTVIEGGSITIHDGKDKNARITDGGVILEGGNDLENILIYPNPVYDIVTIEISNEFVSDGVKIHLFNLTGMEMTIQNQFSIHQNSLNVDLSNIPPGLYLMLIENDNNLIKYKLTKM